MIKVNDILKYTTSSGGDNIYHVQELYWDGEDMITISWQICEMENAWDSSTHPLSALESLMCRGGVTIIGNSDRKPIMNIREHKFLT